MKSRDVTAAYSGGWAGSLVSISPASALSLPDAALGPAAFASRAWLGVMCMFVGGAFAWVVSAAATRAWAGPPAGGGAP